MRALFPCLSLCLSLFLVAAANAKPKQLEAHRWAQVDRIVAIGDLHGDFESYLDVLRAAGLLDAQDRWNAGTTHLVQTGDVPDRGPDTRRILAHLARLAVEARRAGGRVHALIGNHEAMNAYGDLRYVHAGEYAAFVTRHSALERDRYYARWLRDLERTDPVQHAALPKDVRERWNDAHPLGWVEHRRAWEFGREPLGEIARRLATAPIVVQLDDFVFLHGGISSDYCGNSVDALNRRAQAELRATSRQQRVMLTDPRGPLWYRGMAGVAPAMSGDAVDLVLRTHRARHIVIGHTPTPGVIWPRLDARVIRIDTGISAAYGRHLAWLEVRKGALFAGYRGGVVPLPLEDAGRGAYLDAVLALQADEADAEQRVAELRLEASVSGTAAASETAGGVARCDTAR